MSRTVIIVEDGKIIQTIEEENLEGIVIEGGKLKAQDERPAQVAASEGFGAAAREAGQDGGARAPLADSEGAEVPERGMASEGFGAEAREAGQDGSARAPLADSEGAEAPERGMVSGGFGAAAREAASEDFGAGAQTPPSTGFGAAAGAPDAEVDGAHARRAPAGAWGPLGFETAAGKADSEDMGEGTRDSGPEGQDGPARAASSSRDPEAPSEMPDAEVDGMPAWGLDGAARGERGEDGPEGGQQAWGPDGAAQGGPGAMGQTGPMPGGFAAQGGERMGFTGSHGYWRPNAAMYMPNQYGQAPYPSNHYEARAYHAARSGNMGGGAGMGGPQGMRQNYAWRDDQPQPQAEANKEKGRDINIKKVVAVGLVLVLAATAGFGGGLAAMNTMPYSAEAAQQITINPVEQISITEAVAAKVIPSVVGITSKATREVDTFPFGFGVYNQEVGGVGTGIIVDEGGYILTNSHVIIDGEVDSLVVLLPDGREVDGRVLWSERSLDLAIVKVEASNLNAAELGDSDEMRIGAYVAAIGNPLGLDFRSSVSQGVVSGLDRKILASDSSGIGGRPVQMEGLMQVDAAINQGNSGGPLVNSKGEVIGINTAKTQDGEGIGFAIPINTAKPIVESVKETGEFHRVYIGVSTYDVSAFIKEYPHLDLGTATGAYVSSVTQGSPAERSGIRKDDIIVQVNDREIRTSSELAKNLLGFKSGDVVEVTLIRDKERITLSVALTDNLN
ncbi:MAG: trypsin-like peptidase domain-containing protein [Clostridiales Family XIII bacterium]|jgi:S1-C subfamily serine protease|nr:trypsin-like peptidase domain-containing protein [Clostridiales Family XIII bacterium]